MKLQKSTLNVFLLLFCICTSFNLYANYISGLTVIRVLDGDTIDVTNGEKLRIRLANIDAPEKSQPYGMESKAVLSDKIANKVVSIDISTKDRYGRYIGTVYLNDENINRFMVSNGGAWVYRDYCSDKQMYALEMKARFAKSGLWQERDPLQPWVYRRSAQ